MVNQAYKPKMENKETVFTAEDVAKLIGDEVSKQVAGIKEDVGFVRKNLTPEVKDYSNLTGIEKAAQWLKAFAANDFATVKQLSEGVGADGGYLVPTEFRAIVVEKLIKAAVVRPFATTLPMNRDKLEMPVEGTAVTAYWKAENSPLTESNPTFDQVILDTNKLTGLSKMSRELFADSAVNIVSYVAAQFAKTFAKAEDSAFIGGSGTGEPKGLRQYTITNTLPQAGAALTADDIIAIFYKLPSQYRRNAVWLMHNDVIAKVRTLKDLGTGRYIWTDGLGEAPAQVLGRPVLECNDIPVNLGGGGDESEIWFGDMSYYVIGDRQTMEVEQSTQAGDAFVNHQLWLKVVERLDGKLTLTDPFALLTAVK